MYVWMKSQWNGTSMYLIARTEKSKVVRYLLYLCQKSVQDRKLSNLACKTLTAEHVFYHWLKMRAGSVGKFRCSCLSISYVNCRLYSRRKQPTFGEVTPGFPAKWRLRKETRNSRLMTRHYPNLGSASDWSCRVAGKFNSNNQKHYPFQRKV